MSEEEVKKGKGFCGKILNVDLTTGKIEFEQLPEDFYKKYLSGVGLGAKILWDRMKPKADPLGPDNILGLTTGLLTDTGSLFTGRFTAVGKSPQTGGWGDANCGGYFSPFLKRCGIDAVFFYGASSKPVYLLIDDNGAEIKDASSLWGMDAIEVENKLKEIHGKRCQVASIGQSGEKLSLMAGICNDGGRIAARSGLGAVMGSKKLKAVVAAGTKRVGVDDKTTMMELSKKFRQKMEGLQGVKRFLGDTILGITGLMTRKGSVNPRQPADLWRLLLSKFGTPALTAMSAESGDSPIKNWGGVGYTDFPLKTSQKIGAQAVINYEVKKYGCYSCPLHCGGIVKMTDGANKIEEMHKPEYETLCAFGGLILNNDLGSLFMVNDMCNRAGIDTISCGATVAFAVECFENGILTKEDTGGLELRWGKADSIIKLTEMIIKREGIGDILGDGVKIAAQKIGKGAEKFAVHCGGIEPPMHDPKFDPGFIIGYYCEPTPGRHTILSYQYMELQFLEKKFSRAKKLPAFSTVKEKYRFDNKGDGLAVDAFYKMIIDCTGTCFFGTQVGGNIPLGEWMNAATGWKMTNNDYLVIGERVHQLRHAFNVREGLNPIKDFKPHPRVYGDPPLPKGAAKGVTIDIDMMARSYYQAMHWDIETGKTEKEHLKQLGLDEVVEVLY